MRNIKYITPKQLIDNIDTILKKVKKNQVEYIIMVDNEPVARLVPVIDKNKKVFAYIEKGKKKQLNKFLS